MREKQWMTETYASVHADVGVCSGYRIFIPAGACCINCE
jgi:hypothetical protein